MAVKATVIPAVRVVYRALAWGLLGLAVLLVVLPGLEMISDLTLSGDLRARPILLGVVAMMAALSRVGRFPGGSAGSVAPLILIGVVGADYLLEAMGCAFPTGFRPVNAVGLMAVSLGLVRTAGAWGKEAEE